MTKKGDLAGPVFKLKRTFLFDISLGDESFTTRIEIYQGLKDPKLFRCRMWQEETYRIQPTFPQNQVTLEPRREPSDEVVLVEYSHYLPGKWDAFKAKSLDDAQSKVLDALDDFVRKA